MATFLIVPDPDDPPELRETIAQINADWLLYGEVHVTNAPRGLGITRLDPRRTLYVDDATWAAMAAPAGPQTGNVPPTRYTPEAKSALDLIMAGVHRPSDPAIVSPNHYEVLRKAFPDLVPEGDSE